MTKIKDPILEQLRFPTGRFKAPDNIDNITAGQIRSWLADIRALPMQMRTAVESLTEDQLETPYRPDGWTLRQVVHHVADSHINSYIRFRWTLTESQPTIKAYEQADWAVLPDARSAPVELSLSLLDALHARWAELLAAMSENDWKKAYFHPEMKTLIRLDVNLALYAWHGKHHVAHIQSLRDRMNW